MARAWSSLLEANYMNAAFQFVTSDDSSGALSIAFPKSFYALWEDYGIGEENYGSYNCAL